MVRVWDHGFPLVHCRRLSVSDFSNSPKLSLQTDPDLKSAIRQEFFPERDGNGLGNEWAKCNNQIFRFRGYQEPEKFWSNPSNWFFKFDSTLMVWSVRNALINIALGIVMVTMVAGIYEFFRRRKRNWYQVTVAETLIVFGFVSIGMATLMAERQTTKRYSKTNRKYVSSNSVCSRYEVQDSILVVLLNRVFDGSIDFVFNSEQSLLELPMFCRFNELSIDVYKMPNFAKVLSEECYGTVSKITLYSDEANEDDFLEQISIAQIPEHVKTLVMFRPETCGFGELRLFGDLETLYLNEFDFSNFEYPKIRSLRAIHLQDGDFADVDLRRWFDLLPKLETVVIVNFDLVDADSFPNGIKELTVAFIDVLEDARLTSLQRLKDLRRLVIANDSGDKHFEQTLGDLGFTYPNFEHLESLELLKIRIDEKTVKWISTLPQLRRLRINDKRFLESDEFDKLKKRLPNVDIDTSRYLGSFEYYNGSPNW